MNTTTKRSTRRLVASIAIITALATTGAWAEDWTVSENTALTADMTVDALTVEEGVTLDLNGYKLTCSSLSGEGTITSSYVDLTAPGGTCMKVSPSGAYGNTVVANLFNNNFTYVTDKDHRLALRTSQANQKLPLRVDYDFGDGNAKVVDKYKIYTGANGRAPKAWTLYGSNTAYGSADEDGWTKIDERTSETGWTNTSNNNPANSRTYACFNDKAYRYYRLKVTENNGDEYFEIVQLEYFKAGELHLNVESGSSAWPASITFSGEIKVVKDGAGTLDGSGDANGEINMNGAMFLIASGTVQSAGTLRIAQSTSDKTVNVEVAEGGTLHAGDYLAIGCGKYATLTVNGGNVISVNELRVGNGGSGAATMTVNGGSVVARSSTAVASPVSSTGTLIVNGGSFSSAGDLIVGNRGKGTLTVNGGTVEVASGKWTRVGNVKDSTGTVNLNGGQLKSTCVLKVNGTGNLDFNGGTLQANVNNTTNFIGDFTDPVNVLSGGGTIDANGYNVKIMKSISGTGAMRFKGGGTITFSYNCNHTGGTTIELGTKVVATGDTKILDNLVIDGVSCVTSANDIEVFQRSTALTDPDDLANVTLANCGEGSAKKISGNKILVDFVPDVWATVGANTTWSALVAENGEPPSGRPVIIDMTAACTLTIDADVNAAVLSFIGTGASSSTLGIASGVAVSADNYSGLGYVLNNGTFQKWGDGTVEMKFDNASRGVFVVNAGTLKATGKKTPVVDAGTPIVGDPDVTPRSNYLIDVKSGATYDVNGQTSVSACVRLAEGAHFISSEDVANKGWGQTGQLVLAGDADVTANGNFGLNFSAGARLDLGSHTLTVTGASDKEFMLCGTTITGDGTISVASGRFCTRNADSTGEDCTLSIGASGKFENNKHFTVKNFVNNGSMSYASTWGRGELEVTGEFSSKTASYPALTLTGTTVKAKTDAVVTVKDTFKASGTVTIDASEITKEQLDAAMETGNGVPVLTVPTANKGGTWTVSGLGARAKWVDNGDASTLYLCKPDGLMIIIR